MRESRPPMQMGFLAAALLLGGLITYVDSRPTWDDTGVTAAALLASGVALGFLAPKRPWLWALALGIWIPLFGLARGGNYWTLLALIAAFVGAYVGMAIRISLSPIRASE